VPCRIAILEKVMALIQDTDIFSWLFLVSCADRPSDQSSLHHGPPIGDREGLAQLTEGREVSRVLSIWWQFERAHILRLDFA
jgi:hypothetical protein